MKLEEKMGKDIAKNLEWRKSNTKRFEFYLHKELDKDVYEKLESVPNRRQYLIELIREDIKKEA